MGADHGSGAVQLDHVDTTLKAPGSKRLKLTHGKPLSIFAFNFNMRRYMEGVDLFFTVAFAAEMAIKIVALTAWSGPQVGAYTRPLFGSR